MQHLQGGVSTGLEYSDALPFHHRKESRLQLRCHRTELLEQREQFWTFLCYERHLLRLRHGRPIRFQRLNIHPENIPTNPQKKKKSPGIRESSRIQLPLQEGERLTRFSYPVRWNLDQPKSQSVPWSLSRQLSVVVKGEREGKFDVINLEGSGMFE